MVEKLLVGIKWMCVCIVMQMFKLSSWEDYKTLGCLNIFDMLEGGRSVFFHLDQIAKRSHERLFVRPCFRG